MNPNVTVDVGRSEISIFAYNLEDFKKLMRMAGPGVSCSLDEANRIEVGDLLFKIYYMGEWRNEDACKT